MSLRPLSYAALAVAGLAALGGCTRAAGPADATESQAQEAQASSVSVADGWRVYVCADGRIVRALYPDTETARLKLETGEQALKIAISASGARYVGQGLQWWTKGEEASLAPLKPGEDIASAPGVACVPPAQAPVEPPAPGTPGGLPDDRTPLDERPAAPDSPQAAATVVEQYYALVESGRGAETGRLRTDGTPQDLSAFARLSALVGAPGRPEGAAGSTFVKVPVVLYGRYATGPEYHASGHATLRRVNDVPGATADQLRWRIETIEVRPTRR
ncbi:MliC family protein [Phenylobacterium sp.]|uniref:MliC family protein n=1 Tax=Phenylobacterium sp. TaxID=1871053 RepID=UPI00301DC519